VVLLDEPASGLNDEEIERLAHLVGRLATAGATVIVIEHNFRFIRQISHTNHVLHLGQLIASGTAEEVTADQQVIESYLGKAPGPPSTTVAGEVPAEGHLAPISPAAKPLLVVDSLESGYGDLRV